MLAPYSPAVYMDHFCIDGTRNAELVGLLQYLVNEISSEIMQVYTLGLDVSTYQDKKYILIIQAKATI